MDDLMVDGRSLREMVKRMDLISPFGWLGAEADAEFAGNFLLINESVLGDRRYEILVCSECADLGCGAITARIDKERNVYTWSSFGYQNNYEETIDYLAFGTFEFGAEAYESLFKGIIAYRRYNQN